MVFRSVIVARIVPGSEGTVADVFGYYDKTTRPQDLGVIGRSLLSLDDLYIHVIERNVDPKKSPGKPRGLPAFQKIGEAIAPYVTPYPRNWKSASDSVCQEFYSWTPAEVSQPGAAPQPAPQPSQPEPRSGPDPVSDALAQTVIVGRITPGTEPDIARIFGEYDAGPLPAETGVTGRWLYSNDDVYLHLLQRTEEALADGMRRSHGEPAFVRIMNDLKPLISPYNPDTWRSHEDAVAKVFYRWRADS